MTTHPEQAAALLAAARRDGRRIVLPQTLLPRCAADAYAIQDAVGAQLSAGTRIRGWKVGAAGPQAEPSAAPIYDVLDGPARIDPRRLTTIGVETEIAAVFGNDLPSRPAAYTEAEVRAAVSELRVAIEVCDSRLQHWETAPDLVKLADHQINFALVLGDKVAAFDRIDFAALAVKTIVNGKTVNSGVGCHAVGNPLRLLPWLVNHARMRGGIATGTAVTTGAWLGMHFVEPGARVIAEFESLGRAQVEFVA